MAKSDKIERSPAPDVTVSVHHIDNRAVTLNKLDQENPGFVHMFQRKEALEDPMELKAKNQEVVIGSDGQPVFVGRDPIVRVPKAIWEQMQEAQNTRAREIIDTIKDPNESTVVRAPKAPMKERNKPGG